VTLPSRGFGPFRASPFLALGAAILFSGCGGDPVRFRPLPDDERRALGAELRERGSPPEEYVLAKLRENRVVLLGEMHRIRHDVLFVLDLMPRLREAGVTDVGAEFYCETDQPELDAVVTAAEFDEASARELLRHNTGGTWAYREYLDLLRVAWQVNRDRAAGEPPLRVVGLSPRIDYERRHDGSEAEQAAEQEKGRRYDRIMAEALRREVLDRGRKALVYCGIHHAFSGFHQPRRVDGEPAGQIVRCGNILRDAFPDSVVTIYLHAPWYADGEPLRFHLPCGGAFDQAFHEHGEAVGFDLAGGPFASLRDPGTTYAFGRPEFAAGDFADGWVLLRPIGEYEGVALIEDWVESPEMFERLKRSIPNREWGATLTSPEEYLHGLGRDAELRRIYREPIEEFERWAASRGS
jgi:hypothetical protein